MRLIRKATISSLLIMFVTLNSAVFASDIADEPVLTLKPLSKDSKLVLTVRNLKNTKTHIIIKDAYSERVFSKYVNEKDVYMELFNFSRLNRGEYTFYIISGNTTVSQKFELDASGDISVADESVTERITPDIRLRDGKVEVRLANRLKEAVSVSIYDENGQLVHEDAQSKKDDYGKSFNLTRINGGKYTFKVQAGEKSFEKVIAVSK
mgnify:CR=1 FL=1